MVCDTIVGPIIGSNFLAEVATTHLRTPDRLVLLVLLSLHHRIDSLVQCLESFLPVLVLVSLVLTLRLDAGRVVDDANSRISRIDVLAASTRSPFRLNCDVLRIDREITRHLRHNNYDASR